MIFVRVLFRWAVTSNDRAVLNARAAATDCSRQRVERAEVEQLLAAIERFGLEATPKEAAAGR